MKMTVNAIIYAVIPRGMKNNHSIYRESFAKTISLDI